MELSGFKDRNNKNIKEGDYLLLINWLPLNPIGNETKYNEIRKVEIKDENGKKIFIVRSLIDKDCYCNLEMVNTILSEVTDKPKKKDIITESNILLDKNGKEIKEGDYLKVTSKSYKGIPKATYNFFKRSADKAGLKFDEKNYRKSKRFDFYYELDDLGNKIPIREKSIKQVLMFKGELVFGCESEVVYISEYKTKNLEIVKKEI